MYTEDLTIYLSCNREEIKEVHELSPDEGASVFTNNFSLESKNSETVSIRDFEMATERVIGGIERKLPQSKQELKTVAYHEAGHAVAGWFSEWSAPLIKLTIIPRAKGSLGFAQYLPDEISLYTKEQLQDMIKVALAGRIAEEMFFDRITTGASDDLKKCNQIATGIVTEYGMSAKLGMINFS